MADPLGTLENALTVLKLATAATQYIKEVKNGSSERLRLRDELRSTTCLLEMLRDRLEDGENVEDSDESTLKPLSIASLSDEDGPLALFRKVLEDIINKLVPENPLRKLAQPFTWPFDKKDVAEHLATLERIKSHFNLVLQNDLIELAKLSHLKLDNIQRQVETAASRSLDSETENIISWISPLSYRARHLDVLNTAQSGTGTWFLHHPVFNMWVHGEVKVLWCPGIPGSGKTILASLIINKLENDHNSASTLCAYVYCSYEKRREQTPVVLLSSILQQVIRQSGASSLPEEVLSMYQLHHKNGTRPTLAQVTEALRAVTAKFTVFRVIVDALDECAESEDDALHFISAIRSLGPSIRLLCTSRFSSVFESYFADAHHIEISARREDIRLYLDSEIQRHARLARHVHDDPALKQEIIDTITEESRGMFLLAKLHLESLSTKISRKAIRLALKTLPTTLDTTYFEAAQRIHNQPPDLAHIAKSVLFWVMCAKRPLTVQELRHMYATLELPENTPLEDDDLPDAELLTSTCGGLLQVGRSPQTVRVVHYTAQEYFERNHAQELEAARLSMANACLAYILLPNFSDGPCTTDTTMVQRLEQFPFLDYASRYWGADIGSLSINVPNDPVWARLDSLLSNSSAREVVWQVRNLLRGRSDQWSQEYPRNVPPLVMVASFDMPHILQRLITEEGHPVDSCGNDQVTALICAAGCGLAANVRVLIEHGANIEAQDFMEDTALQKAARAGSEDVVNMLIEAGANVNARAYFYTTLMSAVVGGNLTVVRRLIEGGADVEAQTLWGMTALTEALLNGQQAIALYLMDQGATLPRNNSGRLALQVASNHGMHRVIGRLEADRYRTVAERPLRRQTQPREATEVSESTVNGVVASEELQEDNIASGGPEDDPWDRTDWLIVTGGFSKLFEFEEVIRAGHFAEVCKYRNRVTNVAVAVKTFKCKPNTRLSKLPCTSRNEIELLRKMQEEPHPAILNLIDVYFDFIRWKLLVVTELANGDLFDLVVSKEKLSEEETRRVFTQLLSAVGYLHDRGWVHRDIKPENILIFDKETLSIKLADFGLAKELPVESGSWVYNATLVGTPSYVAPEVLTNAPNRKCGTPTDIWSCGVVLYICLCGFPPFSDELMTEDFPYSLADQIRRGLYFYPSPYWDPVSDLALDLIDRMLVVDMTRRISAMECLEHPWIRHNTGD